MSSPTSLTARVPRPGQATAEVRDQAGSGLAKVGIVLGVASLPVLRPPFLRNLAPADLGIVLAIGMVLVWAGTTRQRLRLPYAAGVGLMVIAGTLSALFGELPWLGALTVMQDLYLLAWGAVLANFGCSAAGADFLVRTWCVTASAWAVGLVVVFGPSVLSGKGNVRVAFTFADENGAGLYFAMSLLVIIAARRPRRWRWRGPAIGCLLLALLMTGSLGALSGLLAGLAVALVLEVRAKQGPDTAIAFSLAVLLALASMALLAQREDVVVAASESQNTLIRNSLGRGAASKSERTTLAGYTLGLWQTSGLLGRGPATTEYTLKKQQASYAKEAHNDWIAAMIERGVLGFAGLLLLVLEIFLLALAIWNPYRLTAGYRAALPAPAYVVGALVTAAMYSFTHEELHERTLWLLLGLLAAVGLWGRPVRWSWGGIAMKALVTGAAGFVGSHLCERLLDDGIEVRGLDSFTDYYGRVGKEGNLVELRGRAGFGLVEGDVVEIALHPLLDGVDWVFHLAGQPGVRASWGPDFPNYVRHNVLATQRLLEACKGRPLRKLVYASSSSVYGDAESYPTSETLRPQPVSPYGVTKLAAEHLCEVYRKNFNVPVASLRLFTVYGPRQRPDMAFSRVIRAALAGEEFEVYGDGDQTRDFTFVEDVVEAMRDVSRSPWCGVANIGGGSRTSLNGVLEIVRDLCGEIRLRRRPPAAGDVRHTAADISLARAAFGYRPRTSLAQGLAAMVAWERSSQKVMT